MSNLLAVAGRFARACATGFSPSSLVSGRSRPPLAESGPPPARPPVWLLAGLVTLGASAPLAAQPAGRLEPVVVTASRFGDPELSTPANVLVITRDDILASGARTLPEALRLVAGVQVSSLYGSVGADTAVDMRGFGEGGPHRTLVMLDGQRLNPLDSSNIDWGLVPLDSIDRIEVMSGSGAVLYGDNAVGGVINLITDRDRTDSSSGQVGLGSARGRQLSASLSRKSGDASFSIAANRQSTDGWRDNNRQERSNMAARLGLRLDAGEAFVSMGWSMLDAGLPGALTRAQYLANPRQAETRDSFVERQGAYIRPGLTLQISDRLSFAAELGYAELRSNAWVSNYSVDGYGRRRTETLSLTPRLQWRHGLGELASKTTFGFDRYDGDLNSDSSNTLGGPVSRTVRINQLSEAVYVQNQTRLGKDVTLSAGARRQWIDQTAADSRGLGLDNRHQRTIGDLGLSWRVDPGLRVFTRTGTSFRFANLDDLTAWSGFVSKPVRPERGGFLDVGAQVTGAGYSAQVTAYRLDMTDEIVYNGLTFENENLAKTRHQGLDSNLRVDLARAWQLSGGLSLVNARFREGADTGRKVPLVPAYKASAGLSYKPVAAIQVSLLAVHVAQRYAGGDTRNQDYPPLEAFTTFDLVASWRHEDWTLRGKLANLTDRCYAPMGYYGSYYPADGRSFFLDLRRSF